MSQSIDIAPHLQRVLDTMSKDLAVEPEVLVNQAVHAWLRLNGFGAAAAVPAVEAPLRPPMSSSPTPVPVVVPEVPVAVAAPVVAAPVTADLGPALARMAEIDVDLEKLARPLPAWAPVPAEQEEEAAPEEPEAAAAPPEVEEPEAPEEPGLDGNTGETGIEEPDESTIVLRSVPIGLYLQREGEEPVKVTSDRFIIGRGPHCDLVIDSPRVSREHVALTRKGILFYLEDLNSSNGTWLGEERVTRRELESGDVINLGNEPVTFILRGE